jgi:hypothetical protein
VEERVHRGEGLQILKGEELRAFKAAAKANGRIPFAFASHALVLFEPGVHLVSLKTEKELGVKLRRLLVDEVLPKMLRGELIPPREVTLPQSPVVDERVIELRMVEAQNDRASLLAQIASMSQAAGAPPKAVQAYLNAAASILVGRPLLEAAPSLESQLYTARSVSRTASRGGSSVRSPASSGSSGRRAMASSRCRIRGTTAAPTRTGSTTRRPRS